MKRVYISHPLAGDIAGNRAKVDAICKALIAQGEVLPISPIHLFGYMENDQHRADIMQVDLALLNMVDEIWVYGDSLGCLMEVERARQIGVKVVDMRGEKIA